MNRAATERTLVAFLENGAPGVKAAYLFGSVARGTSDAACRVASQRPRAGRVRRQISRRMAQRSWSRQRPAIFR